MTMFSNRLDKPVGGAEKALGGALEDIPLEMSGRSPWSQYFNDFQMVDLDYVVTTDWSLTQVTSGSASILVDTATADIGVLRLDVTTADQGPIIQLDSSGTAGQATVGVTPAAAVASTSIASDAMMFARFRILDVSAQGTFVGLAELNGTSAVIATAAGGITSDTHIGFHTDASGVLVFTASGDTDTTADTTTTSHTLVDSEWVEVAVRARGVNRATGWVRRDGQNTDWEQVADITTTTSWDAQMLLTLANLGGGAGDDLDVDYVGFAVRRELTA